MAQGDAARPPGGPGGRDRRVFWRIFRAALLPGGEWLVRGRWARGVTALAAWGTLLFVVAARWERLVGILRSGGAVDRISVALTLSAGVAAWAWAVGGAAGRRPDPRWRRDPVVAAFLGNRLAVAGLVTVALLLLAAAGAPLLAPFDPSFQGDLRTERFIAPSAGHPLGTDQAARDVLSRLLHGARISLAIGILSAGIAVGVGTLLGAAAGYLGGAVDAVVVKLVDLFLSFPRLVLLLVVVALFEPSVTVLVLVLGLTLWPATARLVRGEVLSLRERAFVTAGRALGFSRTRIVLAHVVPNVMAPVVVAAALGVGDTIVLEAGVSFLGQGIQPPTPSWGTMVEDGRQVLVRAWWLSAFPGLAIALTVLAFNLVGDGVQEALDPRRRGGRVPAPPETRGGTPPEAAR